VTSDSEHHEIVRTRSGALAVRDLETGEVMHPGVGPLVEAERLYARQSRLGERLRERASEVRAVAPSPAPPPPAAPAPTAPAPTAPSSVVLFDIGMGAASNAAAALAESERAPPWPGAARLELVSFERDLGALRLALSHPTAFGLDGVAGDGARALLSDGRFETARTTWRLEHGDILEALARQARPADIVFWDPFSPRMAPALWSAAAFVLLRRCAGPRCTLFTYSASTAVRMALILAGWAVGVGDDIGDKAATTAAAIAVDDLARPLDPAWLARLRRPDAPLPPDAPPDAVARVAAAPQFHR